MVTASPTVKERILLHLFDHRSTEAYEAPPEITQRGIALAVGIRLRHVSQYVKPLIQQGMLGQRAAHVRGGRQRQLAYTLTLTGRRQAGGLRKVLMREPLPFRRRTGSTEDLTLATIYHENRRGATLLELLQEFRAAGYVSEIPGEDETRGSAVVNFGPKVAGGGPFFGREREQAEVAEAIDRTPLTVVWGIAGIGKTTLGARVCEDLWGNRSIFWHRIRPWDSAMDLGLDLAGFLRAHGRGDLQAYLGRRGAGNLTRIGEFLDSDIRGIRALVVLDDAHKASKEAEAFLSVFAEVLGRQTDTSALVLSRELPDFYPRDPLSLEGKVTELLLSGLEPESGTALLSAVGVDDAHLDELYEQAGGSPLFLKLLAKGLSPSAPAGAWDSVEAYIAREVEPSLNDEERDCLEIASFYEVPVPRGGLLLGQSGGTRTILGLLSKALLEEVEGSRFQAHDVLRHYLQGGMPRGRRRELLGEVVPWLGEEADLASRTEEPYQAIALWENAVAIDLEPGRTSESLERLGDLRQVVGDYPGAKEAFLRARNGLPVPADRARMHRKTAYSLLALWELEEASKHIDRGLSVLPLDPSIEAAELLIARQGLSWYKRDHKRAFADLETVGGWLPSLPEDAHLTGTWAMEMAIHHLFDPHRRDIPTALSYCERSEKALEDIGHNEVLGPLILGAEASFLLGRAQDALAKLEKALQVSRAFGSVRGVASCLFVQARVLMECLGDFRTAENLLEEARKLTRVMSLTHRLAWFPRHFADLYRYQGRIEEAMESLEYFLLVAYEGLSSASRIENLALLARLYAESGDAETAESRLERARQIRAGEPSPTADYYIEWTTGVLQAQKGNRRDAKAGFRAAMALPTPGPRGEIVQEFLATGAREGELLLDYGHFLAETGEKSAARKHLLQAQKAFKDLSLAPLGARASERLASMEVVVAPTPGDG